MRDFKLLKFLDLFKNLFYKMGIDYPIMRRIIALKLLMDTRRSSNKVLGGLYANRRRNKDFSQIKKDSNKSNKMMLVYFIVGLLYLFVFALPISLSFTMMIIITFFLIFIGTMIISDFSTVLLDTRDKNIILSKPVDNKTLSFARIIHIIYYLGFMSLMMILPSVIATAIKFSIIGAIILLIEIIFLDIFIISLTALLYCFVLRFFDGEKLKDVINGIQIVLGMLMFLCSQFMYEAGNFILRFKNTPFHIWNLFIPSFWFGAPFNLLEGNFGKEYIIGTVLAVVIPLVAIFIYIKLMPSFEKNLQKLNTSKGKKKEKTKAKNLFRNIICKNDEERAFYTFSFKMLKNERELKLKLYPMLGRAIITPIVFLVIFIQGQSFAAIRNGYYYFVFYFGTMSIVSCIYMIRYSNNYKASWIYFVAPVKNKRNAYNGALKAFTAKIVSISLIISAIIMLVLFGVRIWSQIISMIFITLSIVPISYKLGEGTPLPFTLSYADRSRGNGGRGFFIIGILLALVAVQFLFIYFIPFGSYIYMILSIVFCIGTWKTTFKE